MSSVWAEEFFRDLTDLKERGDLSLHEKYAVAYRIFHMALNERTTACRLHFSGPFAKLDYLCKEMGIGQEIYRQVNDFRARGRHIGLTDAGLSSATFLADLKTLAGFLALLYGSPAPDCLHTLPSGNGNTPRPLPDLPDCLRVITDDWDEHYITAHTDSGGADILKIDYTSPGSTGSFVYLRSLLDRHTRLNLIRPVTEDGIVHPELIVLEPDYLVDITSVARCFETYGRTHHAHLLNKLRPAANSSAILLGLFSGQLLDEAIHGGENQPDYADSVRQFFKSNALNIATCPDLSPDFHHEARRQQENLRKIVAEQFREDRTLDPDRILLEPSFICEMLGVQGRMDLLQENMRVLMEQKSGKKDFRTNGHKEQHYVQMLLYLAVLHYAFGLRNNEISPYLLYSRYADGLIRETPAPLLLGEAMRLRNELVRAEYRYAEGKAAAVLSSLTPEQLNTAAAKGRLWEQYTRPELSRLLGSIQKASPLEQAYFHRFFTFIEKEHLLSKIGTPDKENSGFASVWNATPEEKFQTGDILCNMEIESLARGKNGEIVSVSLKPKYETGKNEYLPNFRTGDIVMLYPYATGREPDARSSWIFRASIEKIASQGLTLRLRAPQRNAAVLSPATDRLWAIEHDFMESSYTALYRSLHAFLSAPAERRALLLGQRPPRIDRTLELRSETGGDKETADFTELTLRARQARDFFLLSGPPGTGKTSFGLTGILREELSDASASVLLISFTNRAVEEICGKLKNENIDFLRIGPSAVCDESCRDHLLENRVSTARSAEDMRRLIAGTRVFVGTTTSISSSLRLFDLKHFSLAIVDEASQILEPHLLSILSVNDGHGRCAIERFVLIGDHKQLPAVVQQNRTDSAVTEPLLRGIGLTDCRHSLFERLLRLYGSDPCLHFTLCRQGRMHPETASFANSHFYGGRLCPVPLPHQTVRFSAPPAHASLLEQTIGRRFAFLHAEAPERSSSDKVNLSEARLTATLAADLYHRYRYDGRPFLPDRSLGVIVPYRNQIAVIRQALEDLNLPGLSDITIDTVERYQGSERDTIIYSFTVRKRYQLAFLTAERFVENGTLIDRKLNVALTRARERLYLVGNRQLLSADPLFRTLIEAASPETPAAITKNKR